MFIEQHDADHGTLKITLMQHYIRTLTVDCDAATVASDNKQKKGGAMRLDTSEIQRISERLGSLEVRHKLLASYIAVGAEENVLCSEMGLRPHQISGAIHALCTNLHMTYLAPPSWRPYVRAAVLLVASPDKKPVAPPAEKRHRVWKSQWTEAQPFLKGFEQASIRASDPVLGALYQQAPRLLAFAISLCRNVERAEELVQETLSKAFCNLSTFTPGANLKSSISSWMFTIMYNFHKSEFRRRRREIEDVDGMYAGAQASLPNQIEHLELLDLKKALAQIPSNQREAVLLIASGSSYEEAAVALNCNIGTIKSRVNRGRNLLAGILGFGRNVEEPTQEEGFDT